MKGDSLLSASSYQWLPLAKSDSTMFPLEVIYHNAGFLHDGLSTLRACSMVFMTGNRCCFRRTILQDKFVLNGFGVLLDRGPAVGN